jgi:hypothetical protein
MKICIQANTTILPPKEKKKANAHSKNKGTKPPSKQESKYRNIFKQNTLEEERGETYLVLLLGVCSEQKLIARD